ncbi:MAG: FecCD family ABC transporter permease [Dehalococcoidia bacterium]
MLTARSEAREGPPVATPARRLAPSALGPALLALLLVLILAAYLSLIFGAVTLRPGAAFEALFVSNDAFTRTVVWEIRFPRVLDAMVVGASLGIAGALLQGVTRNPLADPAILGLTAAAGLGSALVITINPQVPQWGIVMSAVGGGLVGGGILFIVAWRGTMSPVRLALAGVAISAFFGAAIVGLLASARTFLQTSLGFLAGGLYGAEWGELQAMTPYVVAGMLVALLLGGRLNVLALGDDIAASLGLATDRTRAIIVSTAAVLTGASVATAGLVGFVGLVSPHVTRSFAGQDHRFLIPLSGLVGATLVVIADLGARLVISPSEIPMGIITAAIGAPFLLYIVKVRV